jgi:hypothetical protein
VDIEPEVVRQLLRWKTGQDPPLWQGAVPDMDKLAASIQTDPNGLWWSGSKCNFDEYEAAYFCNGQYLCWEHREKHL